MRAGHVVSRIMLVQSLSGQALRSSQKGKTGRRNKQFSDRLTIAGEGRAARIRARCFRAAKSLNLQEFSMTDARTERAPFNWPAVFMFAITTVPVLTVFPWYAWKFGFDAFEWIWFVVLCFVTGMSITGGYHRFWAHRSYEASKPLQIFYMLFGAMSLQNSILVWASMHRVHHRHVDDV